MPQQSKYSDAQFEALTNDVIAALEKHSPSPDLSLMVLGNVISSILNNQVHQSFRPEMVQTFTKALQRSIGKDDS